MADTSKSTTKAKATKTKKATHKEQEERLDSELADTFPASDPPSLTQPTTEVGGPDRKRRKAKRQEGHHVEFTNGDEPGVKLRKPGVCCSAVGVCVCVFFVV